MEESQVRSFDWAYCGCAVCHSTALISASMKMYALCSKKTGGVTTCQEIHKQGYLEHRELYILKSNIPRHFVSFHCGGLAKSPLVPRPTAPYQRVPRWEGGTSLYPPPKKKKKVAGESALSAAQQRLSARCCEYQKTLQHKHKIYKLIREQVNK